MNNKPVTLESIFTGYKDGCKNLTNIMDKFANMSVNSQNTFIDSKEKMLQEQLAYLKAKENSLLHELREFLAKFNGQFIEINQLKEIFDARLEMCKNERAELETLLATQTTHDQKVIENNEK